MPSTQSVSLPALTVSATWCQSAGVMSLAATTVTGAPPARLSAKTFEPSSPTTSALAPSSSEIALARDCAAAKRSHVEIVMPCAATWRIAPFAGIVITELPLKTAPAPISDAGVTSAWNVAGSVA